MGLFSKSRWTAFSKFFTALPGFSKPDKHSIHFLNIAQFMGVVNDNVFKLVIAFLLIEIKGQEHASTIMWMVGAVYVAPFLLFSSAAGILADRFSKQRLLVAMKIVEMFIMALAMVAFGFQSIWASYLLLFVLSIHSATFGPSKYAIIAELVPSDRVSRANGLVSAFTYLGIICGTVLASFATQMTGRNFVVVGGICLLIAFIGFLSTFGIKHTAPQSLDKKFNLFFPREIYKTLKFCLTRKHLLVAMCGSAYFLFIGAFIQLNIIPFAIDSLKLSDVEGPYLFFWAAVGIALGSYLGGKVSKARVELGLSCIAGFFIAALLLLLSFFPTGLYTVKFLLLFLGIFGGLFIVPFDSFVQVFSPDEKRGQIIASNNFLSFSGVLVASFALFFYSEVLEISPASGFGLTGFFTLLLSLLMFSRLSDLALPFLSKMMIKPFFRVRTEGLELVDKSSGSILVLQKASWTRALLLMSVAPKMHLLLPQGKSRRFPWFNWMFYSIHLVKSDASLKPVLEAAKELSSDTINPCIFVEGDVLPQALQPASLLAAIFKMTPIQFLYVDVDYSRKGTKITFSKK